MKDVAMYLRLSTEDDLIRDESNSISNQRKLLSEYIRGMPEYAGAYIREYKDDGYSGKNMDRPAVNDMLDAVRNGRIGTIIVKDISRFSRDYLVSGKYLEQIFPFMDVRFISVNDNYDSINFRGGIGEIDVAFREILYDYYSEDLSEKIKTSLIATKKNGKFQCSQTPYGYMKDPSDRHVVVVDDEAAAVVREIYRMCIDGMSCRGIATTLNGRGVEPPYAYKLRRFGIGKENATGWVWNATTIKNILRDEFYEGTYVYHKYETKEVGRCYTVQLPPEEWMRHFDHHEGIVSKEVFGLAQEAMEKRKKVTYTGKRKVCYHVLSGKVFCGICGRRMEHVWHKKARFRCGMNGTPVDERHERIFLHDDVLEREILHALSDEIAWLSDMDFVREEKLSSLRCRVEETKGKMTHMMAQRENLLHELQDGYEDYRNDRLAREDYLTMKERLDERIEILDKDIDGAAVLIREIKDEIEQLDNGKPDLSLLGSELLSKEAVETFIDKVTVFPGGQVKIKWKFAEK